MPLPTKEELQNKIILINEKINFLQSEIGSREFKISQLFLLKEKIEKILDYLNNPDLTIPQ